MPVVATLAAPVGSIRYLYTQAAMRIGTVIAGEWKMPLTMRRLIAALLKGQSVSRLAEIL